MLTAVRPFFLLSFLAFSFAVVLPVHAQIAGAPASVTSMGFGGRPINGVPSSVTSLPANGYGNNWSVFGNCCSNFFMPANPNPLLPSRHHRRHKDHAPLIGIPEPVYFPYAYADAPENDNDNYEDSPDGSDRTRASLDPDSSNLDSSAHRTKGRDLSNKTVAAAKIDPVEPVAAQPSTVLVFKDGHQSDVLNYAIVGDTLFDFEAERTRKIPLADLDLTATRKANDDRGVDFQIPSSAKGQ
jgi:hypothetical protein